MNAIRACLALAVLSAWGATLAFARLRSPLDRLHVVTFVNLCSGGAVLAAAWIADGPSVRAWKCLLVWVVVLLSGALLSHASGRALTLRDGSPR